MSSLVRILVALNNENLAQQVARDLIVQKLAACVQLKPITSFYEWEHQLHSTSEIELSIKTDSKHTPQIINYINQQSEYHITQIIVTPIIDGDRAYLEWIQQSVSTINN